MKKLFILTTSCLLSINSFFLYGGRKLLTLEELLKMPATKFDKDETKDHKRSFIREVALSEKAQRFQEELYHNYKTYSTCPKITNSSNNPEENLRRYIKPANQQEKGLLPQVDLYILNWDTILEGLALSNEQKGKIQSFEQDHEQLFQEVKQRIRETQLLGSCQVTQECKIQGKTCYRLCGSLLYQLDKDLTEDCISRLEEVIQRLIQHPSGRKSIITWMSLCEKLGKNPFCFAYGIGDGSQCYANGCIVIEPSEHYNTAGKHTLEKNASVFYHELNHAIHHVCGILMTHTEFDILQKDPWLLNIVLGLNQQLIAERLMELSNTSGQYFEQKSGTDEIILRRAASFQAFQEDPFNWTLCCTAAMCGQDAWKWEIDENKQGFLHFSWESWYVRAYFRRKQHSFEEVWNMLGIYAFKEQDHVKYVINRMADIDLLQYPSIVHRSSNSILDKRIYKWLQPLSEKMCDTISKHTDLPNVPDLPKQENLDILYQLHLRKPGTPCQESLDESTIDGKEYLFVPEEDLIKEEELNLP